MGNLLASGISQHGHLKAFDEMVEARFANLNIEAVLIYIIDTVDADALPILAEQFDVMGVKGYAYAPTEQDKRNLIKKAIELHRYKGTPWSIKEALKAIGYYGAVIQERLINVIFYDGVYTHNGTQLYGPGHWADFRVLIDLGASSGVNAQTAAEAVALINEYKNVRSRLRDVSYMATIQEYVLTDEELIINVESNVVEALGYYHDNTYLYSGSVTHGVVDEDFELIIEN